MQNNEFLRLFTIGTEIASCFMVVLTVNIYHIADCFFFSLEHIFIFREYSHHVIQHIIFVFVEPNYCPVKKGWKNVCCDFMLVFCCLDREMLSRLHLLLSALRFLSACSWLSLRFQKSYRTVSLKFGNRQRYLSVDILTLGF